MVTELFGIVFGGIAAATNTFKATRDLPGDWLIWEVGLVVPVVSGPNVQHEFGFALGSVLATSVSEFDALEQVFPSMIEPTTGRRSLYIAAGEVSVVISGRFLMRPRGRMLQVRWRNGAGVTADCQVMVVAQRLV